MTKLQKKARRWSAARVIHALADLEGVTVENSNGRERFISSTTELAEGGAYDHLMKMGDENPGLLECVLKRAKDRLLKGGEVLVHVCMYIELGKLSCED